MLFLNNYYGIFRAVRNGLGIGTLPDYLASDFPELVQVLPEFQSDMVPVHIAYPQELKSQKGLRHSKTLLLKNYQETETLDRYFKKNIMLSAVK